MFSFFGVAGGERCGPCKISELDFTDFPDPQAESEAYVDDEAVFGVDCGGAQRRSA
jgi:hypothetical protein